MDFTLTPEQKPFRGRVRAWLKENIPKEWASRLGRLRGAARRGLRLPAAAGSASSSKGASSASPAPPRKGGGGRPFMEELILQQEMALGKAPPILNILGVGMAGPTIIAYGTEEQKKRYLREDPLLRGDLVPGLLRAQRGLRPGVAPDARGQGRRPLRDQRPEGVDLARPRRRLDDAAGPHRPRARRSTRASPTSCSTCTRPASR